ncbi:TRAP transporter substrate-binding protein [Chloroflexota bacterium]
MKKKILLIPLALVLIASLIACAAPAPVAGPGTTTTVTVTAPAAGPDPSEVINWRFWNNAPALGTEEKDHRHWMWPYNYQMGAKHILEESGGRLNIEIMTPETSGLTGMETFRALKDNLIEMAMLAFGYLAADYPWVGIFDLPYVIIDPYLDFPKMTGAMEPWTQELEADYDFTIVSNTREHVMKWIALYTKEKLTTLDDLKDLKIRIYTISHEETLKKIGAVPTFIPYAEVPMALKTGVIDAAMTSVGIGYKWNAHEAGIRYQQAVWASPLCAPITVSNKALDTLPPDLKQIFLDGWGKWYEDNNAARTYNDLFYNELLQVDRDFGVEISDPIPEYTETLERYALETDWKVYEETAAPVGSQMVDAVLAAQGRSR